jgi:hypothetical protein
MAEIAQEAFDPLVFDCDVFDTVDTAPFDAGYLRIYAGTQPASTAVAVTTQTLLAELRWSVPSFGDAVGGVRTAALVVGDGSANAAGIATWFRAVRENGTTVVADGSVGTASGDLRLNTVMVMAGCSVTIATFTYTDGTLAGTGLVLPVRGTRHGGVGPISLGYPRRRVVRG